MLVLTSEGHQRGFSTRSSYMMLSFILRLQFWIMYYRFLTKSDSCLSNTGKLQMANITGIQWLYCSGLDLEIPLVSSLSPCSNTYRNKVDQCISDFASAFMMKETAESLCRYDIVCFLLTSFSELLPLYAYKENKFLFARSTPVPPPPSDGKHNVPDQGSNPDRSIQSRAH